ncbi:hypothetical protein [Butyrivibrio fibrisolvens]|uniref:hypothetical protein n=1 Tax=Butyrivibrio fibrisolvens TaxID=831 RepID=UPI00041F1AB8|nr:hypothetical protein [Butyrivibrio fibrisolvens]
MSKDVVYILTVRCNDSKCEENLESHMIINVDENAIYIQDKKILRKNLMEVEIIKDEKDEMILRVPFLIKEDAIVWVREVFIEIQKRGTVDMYNAVKAEWLKIMHPKHDVKWFTGGRKVEEWREEMKSIVEKL